MAGFRLLTWKTGQDCAVYEYCLGAVKAAWRVYMGVCGIQTKCLKMVHRNQPHVGCSLFQGGLATDSMA